MRREEEEDLDNTAAADADAEALRRAREELATSGIVTADDGAQKTEEMEADVKLKRASASVTSTRRFR